MIEFNPGFDMTVNEEAMTFIYGHETFGPDVERRYLDDIRKSLKNPATAGPKVPYAIAMDVGKKRDISDLKNRHLLYGAVIYSKGRFGEEPVRSQGHIHAVSNSCGSSTPEVYEIWKGEAIIYMQEKVKDNPGKCFAVKAKAGEIVIVPPNWAHCTINANPEKNMIFGAWCIRDYGFEYDAIRSHGGLAYFPILNENNTIRWVMNDAYQASQMIEKDARAYPEFKLQKGIPIYRQYEMNHDIFTFVTHPQTANDIWQSFEP